MIRRVNNFSLVHCIVISIIIHSFVLFAFFYKNSKKNVFVQVPFEVSFYSPIQTTVPKVIEPQEEVKPAEEPKPVEEVKPVKPKEKKKIAKKDDIVVKKKETKKKEVKKEEVKPVEEQKAVEEKQQKPESGGGSVVSSNRGIMLENKNFKYSYYTNTIVKKISKYWQWSSVTSSFRAVVYFKIAKDGSAYDIKIKESSSDANFDQNAMRAIQLASPFAPLPSSYEENYLGVYFEFKFH
ncbi:MAG: TonB C-terminal domain-containing protein [Endomicrobiaceae bacterium]|nr:TonB C-terminal domain-containing protein [Endomicrobiaceae bacterium]